MKFNININQKAIIDNGWDLGLDHLAILDVIVSMINSGMFISINDKSGTWYWCKVSMILAQLPILGIKERRCKDLISKLCDYGLIETNPNNQNLGAHYLRIGENYMKYVFSDTMQENAGLCKKLHTPYAKNCTPPMQKIADYNSINDNSINDNKKEAPQNENSQIIEIETQDFEIIETEKTKPTSKRQKKIERKEVGPESYENRKLSESEQMLLNDLQFREAWEELLTTKKWRNKEQSAINKSLKLLSNYCPEFATILCEKAISGQYQGVVYSDTPNHYEKWKKQKYGSMTADDKLRQSQINLLIDIQKNGIEGPKPF